MNWISYACFIDSNDNERIYRLEVDVALGIYWKILIKTNDKCLLAIPFQVLYETGLFTFISDVSNLQLPIIDNYVLQNEWIDKVDWNDYQFIVIYRSLLLVPIQLLIAILCSKIYFRFEEEMFKSTGVEDAQVGN